MELPVASTPHEIRVPHRVQAENSPGIVCNLASGPALFVFIVLTTAVSSCAYTHNNCDMSSVAQQCDSWHRHKRCSLTCDRSCARGQFCGAEALRFGLAWRWAGRRTRRWLALRSVVGRLSWYGRRCPCRGPRCRQSRSRSGGRRRHSNGRWGAWLRRCYWRQRLVLGSHVHVRLVVGWSGRGRLPLWRAGLRGIFDLCACASSTSEGVARKGLSLSNDKKCRSR